MLHLVEQLLAQIIDARHHKLHHNMPIRSAAPTKIVPAFYTPTHFPYNSAFGTTKLSSEL